MQGDILEGIISEERWDRDQLLILAAVECNYGVYTQDLAPQCAGCHDRCNVRRNDLKQAFICKNPSCSVHKINIAEEGEYARS